MTDPSPRRTGLWLQEARACERSGAAISTPLPKGSLINADMGYFTLKDMRERDKRGGSSTLRSMKANSRCCPASANMPR